LPVAHSLRSAKRGRCSVSGSRRLERPPRIARLAAPYRASLAAQAGGISRHAPP